MTKKSLDNIINDILKTTKRDFMRGMKEIQNIPKENIWITDVMREIKNSADGTLDIVLLHIGLRAKKRDLGKSYLEHVLNDRSGKYPDKVKNLALLLMEKHFSKDK